MVAENNVNFLSKIMYFSLYFVRISSQRMNSKSMSISLTV